MSIRFETQPDGLTAVFRGDERLATGSDEFVRAKFAAETGQPLLSSPVAPGDAGAGPVGLISTERGQRALTDLQGQEARLGSAAPVPTLDTGEPQAVEGFMRGAGDQAQDMGEVTLVNEHGQSVSFTSDYANDPANRNRIQSYLNSGFQLESASGNVPGFFSSGGFTIPTQTDDELAIQQALNDINSLTNDLRNLDVSQDPAYQQMVNSITQTFDSRIQQMEDINKSRQASLEKTGIRLGSRFSGPVFGGVVAEEERQGVQRITELEAAKQSALVEARQAFRSQKFDEYAAFIELAENNYNRAIKEVERLNELAVAQNKKLAEDRTVEKQVAIVDLINEGINSPFEIFAKLQGQGFSNLTFDEVTGITDSIKEAEGESFQADIQEWRDAISSGAVDATTSFASWLDIKDPAAALKRKKLGLDIQKLEQDLRSTPGEDGLDVSGDTLVGTARGQAIEAVIDGIKFPSVDARDDAKAIIRQMIADGRVKDAKEQVMQYLVNNASQSDRDIFTAKDNVIRHLGIIDRKIKEFEAAGGDTGVFIGLGQRALERGGGSIGSIKADPALVGIANTIMAAIIDYRRAVSGAAFTESEAKAYERLFPSVGKTAGVNQAKINSLIDLFEADKEAWVKLRVGDRKYEKIFGDLDTIVSTGLVDVEELGDEELLDLIQLQESNYIQGQLFEATDPFANFR
jgi:hypothetical protein